MTGPHQDQPLVTAGTPLDAAEAAVVLVHGRGATARGVVRMADEFHEHGVAFLAPQAARNTWYPDSFLASVERNEPGRSSGLQAIRDAVAKANDVGTPTERVMLLGFSQGACLASEFVARNPRRYGGLAVLSGGLIGPDVDPAGYEGSVDGTPVFLGCDNEDPHIPLERVRETTAAFERLDADVTERIYGNLGHGINGDEIDHVSEMVRGLLETRSTG